MTAELQSAELACRINVPGLPDGYYRSKLFIAANSATNPLMAAAGPLLSLLERLNISASLPPVTQMRDNIQHELHAFASRLKSLEYTEELIFIAYYLLSATIDELLGKSYLRIYHEQIEFQAFTPLAPDATGPEKRFFQILDEVKKRATQYLDLIELGYYCLITGFEGEHHMHANGRQNLDNLIEELYHLIQQHRVHKTQRMFHQKASATPKRQNRHKILIIAALSMVTLLVGTFFLSSHNLEQRAEYILTSHFQTADNR